MGEIKRVEVFPERLDNKDPPENKAKFFGNDATLTKLYKQGACLYDKGRNIKILNKKIPEDLQGRLNKILKSLVNDKDLVRFIPKEGGKLRFEIGKKDFIFRIGAKEFKIENYQERYLKNYGLFKINSVFQDFSSMIVKAFNYAQTANLNGFKILDKNNSTVQKAQQAFERIKDNLPSSQFENQAALKWLQEHKGKILWVSNVANVIQDILSTSKKMQLWRAAFIGIKGLSMLMVCYTSLREELDLREKKTTETSRLFSDLKLFVNGVGVVMGAVLIATSIAMVSAAKTISEKTKNLINALSRIYIWLAAVYNVVFEIICINNLNGILTHRKELNNFLKNDKLNDFEKMRGYLMCLKKEMLISDTEILEDEEKNDENTVSKISRLKLLMDKPLTDKLTKEIDEIISSLDRKDPAALLRAKEMVKEIDKISYQKIITNIVYLLIGAVVLGLLLANCELWFVWAVIAAIYVGWDQAYFNNAITNFIYQVSKEKEVNKNLHTTIKIHSRPKVNGKGCPANFAGI